MKNKKIKMYIVDMITQIDNNKLLIIIFNFVQKCYLKR